MARAVLLPYPGDPFLLEYWLGGFNRIWGDEVDKLYIHLNSPIEDTVVKYIKQLTDNKKIVLKYTNHQIEHGDAINELLDMVDEEFVMLIEDDFYILKKGMVNRCFMFIETGIADVVGSKRGSCATEILQASKDKYGLDYEGVGDMGCNFWPCAFFSRKQLLLDTDRNFKAKAWNKGDRIEELDLEVNETIYGDTFVNTSIQIMNKIPQNRIIYVPQYHGSPNDIEDANRGINLFDGKAPWTHAGSLSSGIGGALMDDKYRPLALRKINQPQTQSDLPIHTQAEKKEWERRCMWWMLFYDNSNPPDYMKTFHRLYGEAIYRIIGEYDLSRVNIRQRYNIYKKKLGV